MSSCRCVTRLRTIYTDEAFADLFPTHGQPAEAPWRLALVTVFQFMENLTDRLTWKYALSLELTDTGFDHTVLSEFRSRLVEGNAEQRLLHLLLERCREGGWLKAHVRQRTDSTHVLATIRAQNHACLRLSSLMLPVTWTGARVAQRAVLLCSSSPTGRISARVFYGQRIGNTSPLKKLESQKGCSQAK